MSMCATCGEDRFGGMSFAGAFVCARCAEQGVPYPPPSERVMADLRRTLEHHENGKGRRDGMPPVHLTLHETDPTKREVWAAVMEREGGLAQAIAAIHHEMIATG